MVSKVEWKRGDGIRGSLANSAAKRQVKEVFEKAWDMVKGTSHHAENEVNPVLDYGPVHQGEHNSRCEKCGWGGFLITCGYCNIVQHAACLMPPQRLPPQGIWACVECTVDAGVGGLTERKDYQSYKAMVQRWIRIALL